MDPSPFLPQTTIAIENVKIAARDAQPKVNIIIEQKLYKLYLIEKEIKKTKLE